MGYKNKEHCQIVYDMTKPYLKPLNEIPKGEYMHMVILKYVYMDVFMSNKIEKFIQIARLNRKWWNENTYELEIPNITREVGMSAQRIESTGHKTEVEAKGLLQTLKDLQTENGKIQQNLEQHKQVNLQMLQNLM